ncbi:uncharacterized protein FOMMEDRAFT_159795 [Fomitiporia mediterranea MF3/22]|uniref:uncharacterized protein n=1 Tax=Fomitiporia mediterranea (strain MF3/22) TaxID=694068 RepID=UPI0004408E0D|nr:uncharacterized protein FOMMEDRAFT_159795 [Fomitiporia mediterranea MF3/22]EJD00149.1 hypothetical protein FOMMEDRAFT_159795 [Fomitiporia mediterranea MF3/22]
MRRENEALRELKDKNGNRVGPRGAEGKYGNSTAHWQVARWPLERAAWAVGSRAIHARIRVDYGTNGS